MKEIARFYAEDLNALNSIIHYMSFIVDKRINGRLYRYRIEAYRDPKTGKPKQRIVEYLGRVVEEGGRKRVLHKESVRPSVEEILPFGDLALLYDTAMKLDFIGTIERMAPRHGAPTGKSMTDLTTS
jgi:hypothetical protein